MNISGGTYYNMVYHQLSAIFVQICLGVAGKATGCSKKTDPLAYFDENFGKYGPILTIFSLSQQEIHDAQKLSYFSHFTFIMMPLYLVKQTLMLVSVLHVCFNEFNGPQSDLKSN